MTVKRDLENVCLLPLCSKPYHHPLIFDGKLCIFPPCIGLSHNLWQSHHFAFKPMVMFLLGYYVLYVRS